MLNVSSFLYFEFLLRIFNFYFIIENSDLLFIYLSEFELYKNLLMNREFFFLNRDFFKTEASLVNQYTDIQLTI